MKTRPKRDEKVLSRRFRVFVGSSSEGLLVARAVQANLDRTCEMVVWNQGMFGLGQGTLETLLKRANEFDFAVLVVIGEDMVESRRTRQQSARDNVLLEAGIFMGTLGSDRTFLVYDRTEDIKIPTDLAGMTLASYEPHLDGNMRAAVGAACTEIRDAMLKASFNPSARRLDTSPGLPYELHHVSLPVGRTVSCWQPSGVRPRSRLSRG